MTENAVFWGCVEANIAEMPEDERARYRAAIRHGIAHPDVAYADFAQDFGVDHERLFEIVCDAFLPAAAWNDYRSEIEAAATMDDVDMRYCADPADRYEGD